jgi:oligogalacturonide lyase
MHQFQQNDYKMRANTCKYVLLALALLSTSSAWGEIGKRFPSEKKVIKDPLTGVTLTFLTSQPHGDAKIYPTHPQWTADGKWVIFRSRMANGEAMAVNEDSGVIVQVSEGGYSGMLNIAQKSMKLYFMRGGRNESKQMIEVDLEKLFADSAAARLKGASAYQRVIGSLPDDMDPGGDTALDADEQWVYFKVGKRAAPKHLALPPDTPVAPNFGPRNMGSGPSGIAKIHVRTGEVVPVVTVPFQVGHIQTNTWTPNEVIFCWETGGKSPQRTWTVKGDGSGLRPLYPEAEYEWVTHEAVISKDEVAMAIMGHRTIPGANPQVAGAPTDVGGANPGQDAAWGNNGTREKPTGLAIVNLRTREVMIAGQTESGSGFWHVHGSPDGRFAVGDDFARNLWLIDRRTREMTLLTAGHKVTAADHIHPTFKPDGTKIQIQSAMLSKDNRTMNIALVHVPKQLLSGGKPAPAKKK